MKVRKENKKTHLFEFTLTFNLLNISLGLAVDKAYKLLLDQEQKKRIVDVIHAGKEYVEHMVSIQTLSRTSKIVPLCKFDLLVAISDR